MAKDFRTFIAIDLPDSIKRRAARFIQRYQEWKHYRWSTDENLHLTLNFIGDVSHQEISPLCRKLEDRIKATAPFQISLRGLGAFPKPDRPQVIWVGVSEGNHELTGLYDQVAELLVDLKFDRDRHKFQPHVTLARLRRDKHFDDGVTEVISANGGLDFGSFEANQVVIYESVIEKAGARYTPIARVKLGGI